MLEGRSSIEYGCSQNAPFLTLATTFLVSRSKVSLNLSVTKITYRREWAFSVRQTLPIPANLLQATQRITVKANFMSVHATICEI